jgi:hypothetical protein
MTTTIQKVEVTELAPMLTSFNKALMKMFGKELKAITDETNNAIERGVATDQTAADGETICKQALKALKAANVIRMEYTRPLDQVKTKLINEERRLTSQLQSSADRLDDMLKRRAARIQREKEEAQRKIDEENRRREEEARKEEERRRKISLAKGGTGKVAPIVPEKVIQPIVTRAGMRNTTSIRHIPDTVKIQTAIDEAAAQNKYEPPISIPGIKVFPVWNYKIIDSKSIPDEYKRPVRR